MSLPLIREADTINASPRLASHAPIVNIIIHSDAKDIIFNVKINGTINTNLKVIPSRARRDIKR